MKEWYVLENMLTEQEAAELGKEVRHRDFKETIINKCVEEIKKLVEINTNNPAYCLVESRPRGHVWHTDVGTSNHMTWCKYSASILLTKPEEFTGGYFRTKKKKHKKEHYLNMFLYSSDVEHCVEPSEGNRKTLLMFFG
jgi:hypothetical protein